MEQEKRLDLINEIKHLERELYLRRAQLASCEDTSGAGIYKGLDPTQWKQLFSRCIEEPGQLSSGGDSVNDVAAERQR